jgi:hypothetical protein
MVHAGKEQGEPVMHVHFAVLHTGAICADTSYAINFMLATARAAGIEISPAYYGHSLVYAARDMAAQHVADNKDIDALLFLDSDMVPPVDMLLRLIEADKPVVGALAFKRTPPYEPCIFQHCERDGSAFYLDYPKGLVEVAGIGMACCLIRREVFGMPKPWFFPMPDLGEDLAFCLRARQAGHSIWCDTRVICGHVAHQIITEAHYKACRAAAASAQPPLVKEETAC